MFNSHELDDFARYYGFHFDCCDMAVLMDDFRLDMERGLRGLSSSLPMLPARIVPNGRVPTGRKALALDAGGTNLRAAIVSFGDAGPLIERRREMPMPGTHGALAADAFFDSVAAFCADLLDAPVDGAGFCFSYPMEMTADGDGVPLEFSKEVGLSDLLGRPIGAGLRDALARAGVKAPPRFTLLNDTVSTLLCALTQVPARVPSKLDAAEGTAEGRGDRVNAAAGSVIGMILGTGFNIAYCEKDIPKIGFRADEGACGQAVVCESGSFRFRYQGVLDREFDAGTMNPGAFTTEKVCAGAYLGPLSLVVLKQAVRDGVLHFRRSAELLHMETLNTKDLNALLQSPLAPRGPVGGLFNTDETDALRSLVYIESVLTERAALVAASALAAVAERCGADDPLAPVRAAVEGTTFSVYHFLGEAFRARLHCALSGGAPRFCVLAPVEQASLAGAAAAALL